MESSDDCTEPEPEDSDTALRSPGALVGPLHDVFQGTYMAGSRPLMPAERDLRAEFFDLRIYLIRGVDLDGLMTPATSVEFFAMSLIARGQATWSQLYRLMRSLPRDANLRWKQDSPVAVTLDAPHRVTMGAWNRGPLTGLHTTTRLYPWCTRAISAGPHVGPRSSFHYGDHVAECCRGTAPGQVQPRQHRQLMPAVLSVSRWRTVH